MLSNSLCGMKRKAHGAQEPKAYNVSGYEHRATQRFARTGN